MSELRDIKFGVCETCLKFPCLCQRWSKEHELLAGDPEAMPKLIAQLRATSEQQAQTITRLAGELLASRSHVQAWTSQAEKARAEITLLERDRDEIKATLFQKYDREEELERQLAAIDHRWTRRDIDELEQQLAAREARIAELERSLTGKVLP